MNVEKTTTDCTPMKPEASDEFEYEEYKDGKECCKKHRRIACKVHDRIHLVSIRIRFLFKFICQFL